MKEKNLESLFSQGEERALYSGQDELLTAPSHPQLAHQYLRPIPHRHIA